MGRKKIRGFIIEWYEHDHGHHVHIFNGSKFLGRFDIIRQESMDKRLQIEGQVAKALKEAGFLNK